MNLFERFRQWTRKKALPTHLRHGRLGEAVARQHLQRLGLKHLTSNFRSPRGEIDLVFRDRDCLVFVEVKTRSSEGWVRPAAFVNARKRRLLSLTALDYLRLLRNPPCKLRFDVIEVLLGDGSVREIRHLANTFGLSPPFRYGWNSEEGNRINSSAEGSAGRG
jgi:putative endonuclease